jgi:type I restriction enzyme M protein
MAIHKPWWFHEDRILVSTAPTCGLTKGGRLLPKIDPATGERVRTTDPDTNEAVDAVDDQLLDDMLALERKESTDTLRFVPRASVDDRCAVPIYYERRFNDQFHAAMSHPRFEGFRSASLKDLLENEVIKLRNGHGSPSHDQRVGAIPYIKVSDLRAGLVNINPTNRVPLSVAQKFWRGDSSGLRAYDLLCPERTSKNIGDFCVLMPGQERIVVTKEVIVLRPGPEANFDPFYLLWAMSLNIVRNQWRRVVFMQTNREDVGKRFLEIEVPLPPSREEADLVSASFRNYYQAIATARVDLGDYLRSSREHHFFVAGGAEGEDGDQAGEDTAS